MLGSACPAVLCGAADPKFSVGGSDNRFSLARIDRLHKFVRLPEKSTANFTRFTRGDLSIVSGMTSLW